MDDSTEANQETVLGLVCRQADLQTLCSALCVSKGASTAIMKAGCGAGNSRLSMHFSYHLSMSHEGRHHHGVERFNQQAYWLSKHGGLVRQLTLSSSDAYPGEVEVMCLAVRPPVQLRQLVLSIDRPAAVLQQLDARQLTSLTLGSHFPPGYAAHTSPLVPAALSKLVGLRDLAFLTCPRANDEAELPAALAPALGPMTHLTCLCLAEPLPAAAYQELPSCLQSLCLSRLPAGARLTHLNHLSRLLLYNPKTEATELAANTNNLPQLRQMELQYHDAPQGAEHHAPVFGALHHLKCLRIDHSLRLSNDLTPAVAAGIAAATSLEQLCLRFSSRGTGADVLAALKPLRQLRTLAFKFCPDDSLPSFVLNDVTCLTCINLSCGLQELARFQLYSMGQLQKLVINSSSVSDEGLLAMANYMHGLRFLMLDGCSVTVGGVKAALRGTGFPELRELLVTSSMVKPEDEDEISSHIREARPSVRFIIDDWWIEGLYGD